MPTNILKAILNIKNFGETDFDKIYPPKSEIATDNRINSVGVAFEYYIKDSLCNTFSESHKDEKYSQNFSYLGNQNNPPDLIIKNSDAVEVKKLGGTGSIQLNSSYPKSKLFSKDSRITEECRACDGKWAEKDIIYAIGTVNTSKKFKLLFMVYGDCYAADPYVYERVTDAVSAGVIKTGLELSKTNEIGRVNRVDPLGITDLRIRGMWIIKHPLQVFPDIVPSKTVDGNFHLITIMRKEKYDSFPEEDRLLIENDDEITVSEEKIKDPNNPARLLPAILIRYDRR